MVVYISVAAANDVSEGFADAAGEEDELTTTAATAASAKIANLVVGLGGPTHDGGGRGVEG